MFDKIYKEKIENRILKDVMGLGEKAYIVGVYCAFTPKEIIAAAGAIPVPLCAGNNKPIPEAEAHLPSNLCPLIKSSYGYAITDTCPYFHSTSFIVADATCDGKKKMFELLKKIKPIHVLSLPQTSETKESFNYWMLELFKLKNLLEEKTGNKITDESLSKQIKLYNNYRKALSSLFSLNKENIPLLYGREIDAITGAVTFDYNMEKRTQDIRFAISKIKERMNDFQFLENMKQKPRILLTGCPTTNKKVLDIIEDSGAVVVAMENCGGIKTINLVDENITPMEALAEKYLKIPCACMTPNTERLNLITNIINDYKIDAVVELIWHACHTYNIESYFVSEHVTNKHKKPYLKVVTDYMENDKEQIKTRVEAFLEILKFNFN
ncbi:MAG: 2-hydroxyacyl-CoA dehydratase [Desulfobacterales bacterium]|nr:2-hydroxyacyl-CoA dehydratase [Desulfobacterales bacterium]